MHAIQNSGRPGKERKKKKKGEEHERKERNGKGETIERNKYPEKKVIRLAREDQKGREKENTPSLIQDGSV